MRAAGMALCIDVVLNHTAREHAWAQAALAGDAGKLAYYRTFPDRAEPDAYERTLPEVFPGTAPGNFTWVPELGRWVWTTFNDYQWDLDYTNPEVFRAMAAVMLDLAASGVDVLRLDAVPFLWKRLGTNSQNQPEVHQLIQAFRALIRMAAPGVAFKAEAIVSPQDLVGYLGTGRHQGKECDLAYHNVLMVLLWSSLASRRVALITQTIRSMPPVPPGRGLGDLCALPRRHRLGHHRGGRRRGGRERPPAPALPRRLLRRGLPGHVRARRALPGERGDRRRAHERDGGVAGGARGGARARRCARPPSSRSAGCSCSTRSCSPTAGCR